MPARRGGDRAADGSLYDEEERAFHVSNIISGIYSLGGQADKALVEYRVNFDPVFEAITYRGVPDVRIIVFLGVPVMAMVRLPTRLSGGKANLHQGAIAAGIDIVLDRDQGPLVLELNARPGLAIQIANRTGLKLRLDAVERHIGELKSIAARVAFAKTHFGAGHG